MEITKALHELAKFSTDIFPVMSVYLNPHWDDAHAHRSSAEFFSQHVSQAGALPVDSDAGQASLKHDLQRLTEWSRQRLQRPDDEHAASYALFTCSGVDLWVEFPSPMPFDNELTIADRPALRQLASLDAHYSNALVVFIEARAVRICEVVLGGLLAETIYSDEEAERLALDNWTQVRYRRDVKDDVEGSLQDAANYINRAIEAKPTTSIICSGSAVHGEHMRRLLSPQARAQIVDQLPLHIRATHERILQVARHSLERHARDEEHADVRVLLSSAGSGGLAVLGLASTLAAVNAGVVHKLLLHTDFRRPGWRCLVCDNIGEGIPQRCTVCQGVIHTVEIGDAMIGEVLRHEGFVEPIEPDDRLAAYDGVGALLRYRGPVRKAKG